MMMLRIPYKSFFGLFLSLFFTVLIHQSSAWTAAGSNKIYTRARGSMEMRLRICDLSGAETNTKAMSVSKSNVHTHKRQEVNLQWRKLWWEEGQKMVSLRLATRTLKTVRLKGLDATAKKYGVDLNKFSISYGSGPPKKMAVTSVE